MTTTPQTHGTADVVENLRQALIAEAAEKHAQYPQYAGHWDAWRVAEVTRAVKGSKLGQSFRAGELVLVAPDTYTEKVAPRSRRPMAYQDWPTKTFATAYSRSNGIDTAVLASYIREVTINQ